MRIYKLAGIACVVWGQEVTAEVGEAGEVAVTDRYDMGAQCFVDSECMSRCCAPEMDGKYGGMKGHHDGDYDGHRDGDRDRSLQDLEPESDDESDHDDHEGRY